MCIIGFFRFVIEFAPPHFMLKIKKAELAHELVPFVQLTTLNVPTSDSLYIIYLRGNSKKLDVRR